MHLQRMAAHRAVRILRVVLPFIVIGLIAIFAVNYWMRSGTAPTPQAVQDLPQDLAVLNEGFSFSQTDGGRKVFTVHAQTNVGFQDRKQLLQNVEVVIHRERDGDPERRIVSDQCSYDEQTNNFRFTGNVVVHLDEETTARTDELLYNYATRTVVSTATTTMERPGKMTGRANSLEYALDPGVLKLAGDVRVQLADGAMLESGGAEFHRRENRAVASGGVHLRAQNGWMRGDAARADLAPESFEPRAIELTGNVTAESHAQNSTDVWKLWSQWLKADFALSGVLDHIWTRENVRVEKVSGGEPQIITAEEVDASVDEAGAVSGVAARRNARMTFGVNRSLSSDVIFSNPNGSVLTEDDSVLQVGDSTITGQRFSIEQGQQTTFNTPFRAVLRSANRESAADVTSAKFDGRTNQLSELVQTGNFTFVEGARRGRAEKATVAEGGDVLTLEGGALISDPQQRVEARTVRLDRRLKEFWASGSVKTLTETDGGPVLVHADVAQGDGDAVAYAGAVKLWRPDGYVQADRVDASMRNKTFLAQGNVRSDLQGVRTTSGRLEYDDARQTARYSGNVRAQKKDLTLSSSEMTAVIVNNEVSEIIAEGAVTVIQGARRGVGDSATYDANSGNVVLAGREAEVTDPEQGIVRGARLVMSDSGQRVEVQSGQSGRVTSKIKVKK